MRGSPRTRTVTRADVSRRAVQSADFLEAATEALTLHPDRTNVTASNAVLAGIAAADSICGHALGRCARGESHDEAIQLLRGVAPDGERWATDLRRLLALKTNAQYSPAVLSTSAANDAVRWATRLVEGAQRTLRGR